MTSPSRRNQEGFTLIEILMVILLVAIVSVVATDVISDTANEARFEQTVQKLNQIRDAMIGNPNLRENGARTSFGYLGDVGGIPTLAQGIAALTTNPGVPVAGYAINSTVRIGIGWNGPYLSGGTTGTDYTTDAWGTTIDYSAAAGTLTSYGANKVAGGTGYDQDIVVAMPTEQRVSTVRGFICDRGSVFSALAEVELNYPNGSGVLTQASDPVTVAEAGQFSFANVPFGVRSITVYRPSKAGATSTLGPVVLTIDKPNYNVPCNMVDINP
jgi:general secretion pathway protein G